MKYLDLFSGYGGFSLGIQQAYDHKHSKRIQQGINNKGLPGTRKSLMATKPDKNGKWAIESIDASEEYKNIIKQEERKKIKEWAEKERESTVPIEHQSLRFRGYKSAMGNLIYYLKQ